MKIVSSMYYISKLFYIPGTYPIALVLLLKASSHPGFVDGNVEKGLSIDIWTTSPFFSSSSLSDVDVKDLIAWYSA